MHLHMNIPIQILLQNINSTSAHLHIYFRSISETFFFFAFNLLILKSYFNVLLVGSLHHLSNKFLAPTFFALFSLHSQHKSSLTKGSRHIPTLLCPINTDFEVDVGTGWTNTLTQTTSDKCNFQLRSLQLKKEMGLSATCFVEKHFLKLH